MERADWLKRMRSIAEELYDKLSPQYWITFGLQENSTHLRFLQKFLSELTPGDKVLSAGCGAGRYDGLLLEAGHRVVGIDQSTGMLKRAQEHFPQVDYQKMGIQDMPYRDEFEGIICLEVTEHISPEDYPIVFRKLCQSLKVGGLLYFTVPVEDAHELEGAFERAKRQGLPVVFGEVVDKVESAYAQVKEAGMPVSGELSDGAVYHYYPSLDQVEKWLHQTGLSILDEGEGSGYHHYITRKVPA